MENNLKRADKDMVESISLPRGWCFCFNNGCEAAERCFRRFTATQCSGGRRVGMAVFPQAGESGKCEFFIEKRVVRMAWGLDKLFENVVWRDATPIRKELTGLLGNKGGYYRYNRGEKRLSPKQQELVMAVMRRYGYDDVEFSHYELTYWLGD